MPAVLDLFHGFCATSLVGFLVGFPVGAFGETRGWRVRFLVAGSVASTAALAIIGWPVVWAVVLGVAGAAVSVALSELSGGLPLRGWAADSRSDSDPEPDARAEASVKLRPAVAGVPSGPDKTEAFGTADVDDLPLPDLVLEAAVARRARPVGEPTKQMAPPSKWQEPAQSSSPGDIEVSGAGAWDEPGSQATGPLPVMGKRKLQPMDDVNLEELYDEVDAALNVVPDECPHCSGMNPADARFCKHCSAPLKPWTCKNCQRVNDIDAAFCVRCREPRQMLASPLDVEVIDE